MPKSGPIVIVEDDIDDQEMLTEVIQELNIPNSLKFFTNPPEAFNYLKTTTQNPFIIISDINLPMQTGIEFKQQIDSEPDLREKSIPFVFLSTGATKSSVRDAFTKVSAQGYFEKPRTLQELKKTVAVMIEYWKVGHHPSSMH